MKEFPFVCDEGVEGVLNLCYLYVRRINLLKLMAVLSSGVRGVVIILIFDFWLGHLGILVGLVV